MRNARNHNRRLTLVAVMSLVWIAQPSISSAMDGPAVYQSRCASCHGMDGSGTAGGKKMGVRDFASAEVTKQTDAQLAEAISKGRKKMPGFAKSLKPAEITEQVAFVRALGKGK